MLFRSRRVVVVVVVVVLVLVMVVVVAVTSEYSLLETDPAIHRH